MIHFGDCKEIMQTWPDQSVQMCVTSPPYFGLRDYGTAKWEGGDPGCAHIGKEVRTVSGGAGKQYTNAGSNRVFSGDCDCGARRVDGQIGLEQTPDAYVAKLVDVFREVRRLLRDDGTLWLNLGDSYNAAGRTGHGTREGFKQDTNRASAEGHDQCRPSVDDLKPKDLLGIPWRVAFALQADGWYLRQDIIWAKPNPMPESVRDRCTKAHEYIFLLSKSERYYFDAEAIAEPAATGWNGSEFHTGKTAEHQLGRASTVRKPRPAGNKTHKYVTEYESGNGDEYRTKAGLLKQAGVIYETRNKRSVWTVTTKPFKGAHFATFPPDLIEPCILAGSRKGDVVLDPFMGSGTTAQVAIMHGRQYIGCELNPEYKELQDERIRGAMDQKRQVEMEL